MERSLEVTTEDRGRTCVLHVRGKFTASSVHLLRTEVGGAIKRGMSALVMDLEHTALIDSGAIGFLTNLHKELQRRGGKLCLASLPERIERVLDSCGLLKVMEVYESPSDSDPATSKKKIETEERGFYALLKVPEHFDLESLGPVREALDGLTEAGNTAIVLDFEHTTHISSVGIGVVVNVHKRLKEKGGDVYLVGVSEQVRKLLEVSNVTEVVTVLESVAQVEEKLMG